MTTTRTRPERFRDGDEVTKGQERGTIMLRQNRTTREWFPVVIITEGPRRGQSEYPWKGWRVNVDHGDGRRELCHECEREFRQDRNRVAYLCRQCQAKARRRERPAYDQAAQTFAQAHDELTRPWRSGDWREHGEPGAPTQAKHPAGCLCGETPDCTPF